MSNYHPKDIVYGRARVMWGFGYGRLSEGWVLPGGGRTISRDVAETVCKLMNELME